MCRARFLKLLVLQEGGHEERKRTGLFEFLSKISTLEIENLGGKGRQIFLKRSRTNLEYLCGISDFRAGGRGKSERKSGKTSSGFFLHIWRQPNICLKSHLAICRRGKFKIPLKFPQIIRDFLGLPS